MTRLGLSGDLYGRARHSLCSFLEQLGPASCGFQNSLFYRNSLRLFPAPGLLDTQSGCGQESDILVPRWPHLPGLPLLSHVTSSGPGGCAQAGLFFPILTKECAEGSLNLRSHFWKALMVMDLVSPWCPGPSVEGQRVLVIPAEQE